MAGKGETSRWPCSTREKLSLAIVEFPGLMLYSVATDPVAFPGQFVEFVLASPDRMIVALVLAAVVTLLVLIGSGASQRVRQSE